MSDEPTYPPEHPNLQVELHVKSAKGMPVELRRMDAEFRYSPVSNRYELFSVGDKRVIDTELLSSLGRVAGLGEGALWDEHRESEAQEVHDFLREFSQWLDSGSVEWG